MTVTPSQLGRPVGANGEQTRARIIAAAMRCVAEMGYSRTTIREIARAADMTSGSLYHYFPNKSELLDADRRGHRARSRCLGCGPPPRRPMTWSIASRRCWTSSSRLMREYPYLAAFDRAIRAESNEHPVKAAGRSIPA